MGLAGYTQSSGTGELTFSKFVVLIHCLSGDGRFKIESCKLSIFNDVDELVKLEHKDYFDDHLNGEIFRDFQSHRLSRTDRSSDLSFPCVKNKSKSIQDELLIQQFTNFTQIQGRPTTQRYILCFLSFLKLFEG